MVSVSESFDLEAKLTNALEKSSCIKYVMMEELFDPVNQHTLHDMLVNTYPISATETGLEYKNDDGDIINCPNFGSSISLDGEWLSNILPPITFDTIQGGNVRKSNEAQFAYCCLMVAIVVADDVFKEEFINVIDNYDFQRMDSKSDKSKNFKDLLREWQNLQSWTVNVIISAAKYKLVNLKKTCRKVCYSWFEHRQGGRIARPVSTS